MKCLVLLFIFISKTYAVNLGEFCASDVDSCTQYQCAEYVFNCGEKHYLTKFGHRYCEAFRLQQEKRKFSNQFDNFLSDTRLCLQEKLSDIDFSSSCPEIADYGLESHVDCYLDSGYCELGFNQVGFLFHMISDAVFTEFRGKIIKQFHMISTACSRSE